MSKALSSVDRLYGTVKEMAIAFEFKPGERINEVELARRLGASRTPLREALNRLVAEEFLTFERGRGFFCRELKAREIFELYQLRSVIEVAAVRLACEQANETEVDELTDFLDRTGPDSGGRSSEELVALDEFFHERIMALTRNAEMARCSLWVALRLVSMSIQRKNLMRALMLARIRAILEALRARDADVAARHMEDHIARRLDQITAAIKEGYSRIYMNR